MRMVLNLSIIVEFPQERRQITNALSQFVWKQEKSYNFRSTLQVQQFLQLQRVRIAVYLHEMAKSRTLVRSYECM